MRKPVRPKAAAIVALLPGLLLVAACGDLETRIGTGSPAHPSPIPAFQPGAYHLAIAPGDLAVWVPNLGQPFAANVCLCLGSCPSSVRVPVSVERGDVGFVVRAVHGNLRAILWVNGITAGGTMRGAAAAAPDEAPRRWIEGAEASLSGRILGDRAMGGTIADLRVSFGDARGTGGCSSLTWALSER